MSIRMKLTAGVSVGVVTALVGAGAAMAAPSTYDPNIPLDHGVNASADGQSYNDWSLGDVNASASWMLAHPNNDSYNEYLWDGHGGLGVFNGEGFDFYSNENDASDFRDCVQDSQGIDITVVCADEVIHGLTMHPEVYYYGDANLTRVVWKITNAGSSTVTTTVERFDGSECDGAGYVAASNGDSGNSAAPFTTANWNWMIQRERDNSVGNCAIEASAWQFNLAAVKTTGTSVDDNLNRSYAHFDVTVDAGQTIALAFFYGEAWIDDQNISADTEDPTNPYVVSRAASFQSEFDYFNGNLSTWSSLASRNVAPDLFVVNWMATAPPATPAAPALANTGMNTLSIVGIIALLGIAGFTLRATRRRAKNT